MYVCVSCRDKMRHLAGISHIELLVSVERYGDVHVVCCGKKVFIYLKMQTEIQHFESRSRQEVGFWKKREKRS